MAERILSISWVRNEGDVIEAFVRHHCALVDQMIIIDNDSRDDTPQILASLRNEGLPIEIVHDDARTHRQGEALTALMRQLLDQADAPDWIVPLDADEFLCASGSSVRDTLERSGHDHVLLLPWHTYVPTVHDDLAEKHPLRRIRHRRSAEHPQWHKICIPADLARNSTYVIPMGSHTLFDPVRGVNSPMTESATMHLAHFPVRSINQIQCKVAANWLRHRNHPNYQPGTCYQWQVLFESMKRGDVWDDAALERIGMTYGTAKQWKEWKSMISIEKDLGTLLTVPAAHADESVSLVEDPVQTDVVLRYSHTTLDPRQVLIETEQELLQPTGR